MNYRDLIKRLWLLISSPAKAWEEILIEKDKRKVTSGFVYPLIGLCSLSIFLGSVSFAYEAFSLQTAMTKACAVLVALFGGYFLATYLVGLFDKRLLKREIEQDIFQQFVGYSMSVIFVLDIVLGIFPAFFILRWILQFYIIWVVWEGAQKLMQVPAERLLLYTLLTSCIILISPSIIKVVFDLFVTLR